MDLKQTLQRNALLMAAGAFVIGLLMGWMLLGWVVAPVQYVDAGPANLSDFFKLQYVQLVADSYSLTGDVQTAQERLSYLGKGAGAAVQLAMANTTGMDNLRVAQLAPLVSASGQPAGGGGGGGVVGLLRSLLPICAVGVFLLLVGGGVIFFLRLRRGRAEPPESQPKPTRGVSSGAVSVEVETPESVALQAGDEPVTTFKTTYMLGNDLYDESFSIDDQQGEFLGECGVGIGETVGVGDPKKVAAFEVWLFDKNDIRTVTKVLMSEHAYRDEALKSRLAAKGEPVLAKAGDIIRMETAALNVEARVVDMQYGSGALPPNSFFQQMTLEISAWKKPV